MSIYQPLDSSRQEFRILHVRGSDNEEDTLNCDLETVSLFSRPIYEAISYCWAAASGKRRLRINGLDYEAPASAVKVLRKFRPKHGFRALWIDAICINQDDLSERSRQVNLMGKIYESTMQTLIWLGEQDKYVESAIRTIEHFSAIVQSGGLEQELNHWHKRIVTSKAFPRYEDAYAVAKFFARPWFQRVWVLQEAALAPMSRCFYGERHVMWTDVCQAAHFISIAFESDFELLSECPEGLEMANLGKLLASETRDFKSEHRCILPLYYLLDSARALQASDLRDKFYGILGLSLQRLVDLHELRTIVDYEKPLVELLRDATIAAITEVGDLTMLEQADETGTLGHDTQSIPSWVFRRDRSQHPDEPIRFRRNESHFKRALDSRLLQAPNEPDILLLKGFMVDRVESVFLTFDMPFDTTSRNDLREQFVDFCRKNSPIESLLDAADSHALYHFLITSTAGYLNERFDFDGAMNFSRQLLGQTEVVDDEDFNQSLSFYMDLVSTICLNRRLFITETGKVGLGPAPVQADDLVVTLLGGGYLFVLREIPKVSSTFPEWRGCSLIGTSYVSGVMRGEVVEALDKAGVAPTVFAIS